MPLGLRIEATAAAYVESVNAVVSGKKVSHLELERVSLIEMAAIRSCYWGRGREAILLAPRLQPGDSKPELTKNRF